MNTIIQFPAFICPGCKERGEDPVHYGIGKIIAGKRYCTICAGEILDGITMQVHAWIARRPLCWEGGHRLSLVVYPGTNGGEDIYEITMQCPHWHCGNTRSKTVYPASFSSYWDLLAAFVEEHFTQLKKLFKVT
jgi:hypothetical protein